MWGWQFLHRETGIVSLLGICTGLYPSLQMEHAKVEAYLKQRLTPIG